jgi:hypothetical protein
MKQKWQDFFFIFIFCQKGKHAYFFGRNVRYQYRKMQYLKSMIISLLLLSPLLVFPQKASLIRLEVPASLESGAFQVETIGKEGVLIFYESNEINEDNLRKWYFGLFDTQLKQVWLKFVPLNDGI